MIATVKAARIAIYINSAKKTLAQVKAETGCTHIINGGLFENWKACCQLKANGKVYADDGYKYWGFSWTDVNDFGMEVVPCAKPSYIACVDILRNGKSGDMNVNSQIKGSRQRTAIGIDKDKNIVLYCTQAGRTPEQVRDEMKAAGCVDAVMLDGGLSSQCDLDGWVLTASRRVHNFICVWADKTEGGDKDMALMIGSKGAEVSKLQEKLNILGYGLAVDGDFGNKTDIAVRHFQNYWSLGIDGKVGDKTKERLDKAVSYVKSSDSLISNAAKCVGMSEPEEDDEIIAEYNFMAGTTLPTDAAWCQMFVVVMQRRAGRKPILTPSCTVAMNYYKAKSKWTSFGKAGNLVYFDWDNSGDADHAGIVAEVSGSFVYVIEGNSSGGGYDAVRMKVYNVGDYRIKGYADVSEDVEQPETAYDIAKGKKYILTEKESDVLTVGKLCEILQRAGII